MRAFLKFLINVGLIALVLWLIIRFTTIDDKIIEFFTKSPSTGTVVEGNACITPWGVKIPDGSSIFAYQSSTASANGSCIEEERKCEGGQLKGTYEFGSCNGNGSIPTGTGNNGTGNRQLPPTGASCTTPWGQNIAHGSYIVSYESPSSCRFQRRMCVDGQLLGKFQYNYCMIDYNSLNQGSQASIYDVDSAGSYQELQDFSNSIDGGSPYDTSNDGNNGQSASWHYSPVSYGGNVGNKLLPNDYWNQNAKGNIAVVNTSTIYNPLTTYGTTNYTKPVDWKKNDYTHYDLTQKGCNTPWGSYVDNGQYVIAYKAATVANGHSCEYERRNCINSKLNGGFSFPSCSIKGKTYTSTTYQAQNYSYDKYYRNNNYPATPTSSNKSCYTPRGTWIQNGGYIRAYRYSQAPWSDGCEGEVRYCRDGRLDGSYSNKTCTLKDPTYYGCYGWNCGSNNNWGNSCSLPRGGSISDGQSVVAYDYGSYGGYCRSETRYCSNGYLNGSYGAQYCNNNNYPNYPSNNNACSLPWGGYISHGQTAVAYNNSNGVCNSETRYCNNGYLNGSYSQQSCQNQTYSCPLPRGGTIQNGQSVEAFQSSSSPCYKEIRYCYNGVLNGSFGYASCNLNPTNPTQVDTYGERENAGWYDSVPDGSDTCHTDATASFSCLSQDSLTCVDYRKVSNDCCIAGRAKYEKRTVTCIP